MKAIRCVSTALLATALFTSCSKNEVETPGKEDGAVRFTSAISQSDPMSKAAGTAWANGDKVGIFMVETTTTTLSEMADNRLYTTADANTFTTTTPIYYPVGRSVDFIAYYPYASGQTLWATYPLNVAVQTSQAAIDFMYSNNATAKSKANTDVTMTFVHKLSKVMINTTAGAGLTAADLAAMTVGIKGMHTAAPFDLTHGTLGAYTAPADLTAFAATPGAKYEAIVLPASFAAGKLTMEFALNNPGGELFKRINTTTEAFEADKIYTYNVIVQRTGVTLSCTITNWDTAPTQEIKAQ